MPVTWSLADGVDLTLGAKGLDGTRQMATARAILKDLSDRSGLVLADEVGMGKTYVALAVATAVILNTGPEDGPVVVMMPPHLSRKWPREWRQFRKACVRSDAQGAISAIPWRSAGSPTGFFRALDDRVAIRPRLIFIESNAFARGLDDPWIRLAFIRIARSRTKMEGRMREAVFQYTSSLIHRKRDLGRDDVEWLLTHDLGEWKDYLRDNGFLAKDDDDPIPRHLRLVADRLEAVHERPGDEENPGQSLVELLREGVPRNESVNLRDRLREASHAFREAAWLVYREWLAKAPWRSPLLILDEAHHAKNDSTHLARLFRKEHEEATPLFDGKCDRLLFLTATPFQLHHRELIRILRSFSAVRWTGPAAPSRGQDGFERAMAELSTALDQSQFDLRELDRRWGRVASEMVLAGQAPGTSLEQAAETWWSRASTAPDGFEKGLADLVRRCRESKERAQTLLQPWVIRHNRPRALPAPEGGGKAGARRQLFNGASIRTLDPSARHGLPIDREAILPFLLAEVAQGRGEGRTAGGAPTFGEGLSSSYEAFHHTRDGRAAWEGHKEVGLNPAEDAAPRRARTPGWHESQILRFVPSKQSKRIERLSHPKLGATVQRVVELWKAKEKVLVFCFYRQTTAALRDRLHEAVEDAMVNIVAGHLGATDLEQAKDALERLTNSLQKPDHPIRQSLATVLRPMLDDARLDRAERIQPGIRDRILGWLEATVRAPAFFCRFFPLDRPEVRRYLLRERVDRDTASACAKAVAAALGSQGDSTGQGFLSRVREFVDFVGEKAELSDEGASPDADDEPDPLREYLGALGRYAQRRVADDDDEAVEGTFRAQSVVRRVWGPTAPETRERVMLAFNSPLMPDILVSSQVLGEGVDLHRFCRHVIHHDLDWNPSVIEQRTGRVDRIRCWAETCRRPIEVYLPYLAGSADERMYRVLRDRERWFQVVMGQDFARDEATTEALAGRVPLPESLAHTLAYDLARWREAPV